MMEHGMIGARPVQMEKLKIEEMIDTWTPEELANPAMLQMAYMAGDYYRESEYDDQYSAEAYWTTKGKFKGKGKTFFGTCKHYTL